MEKGVCGMREDRGLIRLRFLAVVGILANVTAVLHAGDAARETKRPDIVPAPRSVEVSQGNLVLGARVVAGQAELRPLAGILVDEMRLLTGKKMSVVPEEPGAGGILLEIDKRLTGEEYVLETGDMAVVRGGNYMAVAMGTVSLLQAVSVREGAVIVSRMTVKDRPVASYRGLLIDLARKWHKPETVKQIVVMCRWYKIGYLQLHLTDDQSFVFPSQAYPQAATSGRSYTSEELRELEVFARDRGVVIVPELEAPGHSRALRQALPQLNCSAGGAAICPGKESTYEVLDKLTGEMAAVFQTTPYFDIGNAA